MDAVENALYIRRWSLAFENFSASRREPTGSTSFYSLRTPIKHRLPNGRTIEMKEKHRLVWHALLIRAYDLSKSVTETWVGLERLSQETGLSADLVGSVIKDLENLGWVRRKIRAKTSPVTTIYLQPHLNKETQEAELVSLANEDMGYYVCEAAQREWVYTNSTSKTTQSLPADFHHLEELLRKALPDHAIFLRTDVNRVLTKTLLKCVDTAGSVKRCYQVLNHYLYPKATEGKAMFAQIAASKDLSAHIDLFFLTWLAMFPYEFPENEEDNTSGENPR